jgi:hypothetical protein
VTVTGFKSPKVDAYVRQLAEQGLVFGALVAAGDHEALTRVVVQSQGYGEDNIRIAIEPKHLPGVVALGKRCPEVQRIISGGRLFLIYERKQTKRELRRQGGRAA